MQQYRITTCEPESCCVSAVAIDNGQLKITLENGQEFTAALPADKHVTGASVAGDVVTLAVADGSSVKLDLSGLLNPIRQNNVVSGELAGETIQFKNEAGQVVSTIDLSDLIPDDPVPVETTGAVTGNGTVAQPLDVRQASTTAAGVVEFATATEARAGTASNLAVTPAGVKAALDAAAPTTASAQTAGVVKLGDRVLANDGKTVLGYLVNV